MDLQSYLSASIRAHDMGLLRASMYDDSQRTFVDLYVREALADEESLGRFPGAGSCTPVLTLGLRQLKSFSSAVQYDEGM